MKKLPFTFSLAAIFLISCAFYLRKTPAESSLAKRPRLPEAYLVSYGNPDAPIKITEYFSFFCPHCIAYFREDFGEIYEKFIRTEKIYWIFHPVPMDMLTVRAMECLRRLGGKEKRALLKSIMEEADIDDEIFNVQLFKSAMEFFDMPIDSLEKRESIENSPAIEDAFDFVKLGEVSQLPSLEINGEYFPNEVPSLSFIKKVCQ